MTSRHWPAGLLGASTVALTIPLVLIGASAPIAAQESTFDTYAYTLLAPVSESASQLIVRSAQAPSSGCPSLTTTDTATGASATSPLTLRAAPSGTGSSFAAASVCEIAVPSGAGATGTVAYSDGTTLSVPTAVSPAVSKVAAIGDTGCRLVYNIQQNCESSRDWPLKSFAHQIAKDDPDVVLLLGDYFYISWPCEKKSACGNVPPVTRGKAYQDSAAGFAYEFLAPVASVFPVAPMLALRGSEEVCSTAGISFFYFLDPHFGTSHTCDPVRGKAPISYSDSYAIDLTTSLQKSLRLVVADSSLADDQAVDNLAPRMRPKFAQAAKLAQAAPVADSTWLVTHRPVFAVRSNLQCGDKRCAPFSRDPNTSLWVSADVAAASYGLLKPYDAIMSGHVHLTQAVQVPGQPAQFTLGAGGTALDPAEGYARPKYGQLATGRGARMDPHLKPYPTAREWTTKVEFSYGLGTPTASGWSFEAKGLGNRNVAHCSLRGAVVSC